MGFLTYLLSYDLHTTLSGQIKIKIIYTFTDESKDLKRLNNSLKVHVLTNLEE